MAYFDATDAYAVSLLGDDVQTSDRLIAMARWAEQDIVDRYTESLRRRPTGEFFDDVYELADGVRGVFLNGYDPDVTLATGYNATASAWTDFAQAMRRACAALITHRLTHMDSDPTIIMQVRGSRTTVRRGVFNKDWTPEVDRILRPYDLRQVLYAIG